MGSIEKDVFANQTLLTLIHKTTYISWSLEYDISIMPVV